MTGWALSVLGVLVAVAGVALMVLLGPDSRISTGPHAIETDDIAVVTSPQVIRWADVQVDVLVEVPVRKPVFVGIGNAVDVQNYVAKVQRLEVTSFSRPWRLRTRAVEGQPNLPGAPTAIDWWIDSSAGLGGASISARLPDETVSIAVLSVGSSNLAGLEVTLAYGVKGGFAKGISALLLGLAALWLGVMVLRSRWADDDWDDGEDDEIDGAGTLEVEEVVYVYVDDDGVEHEITAEEAAELEVVEEVADDAGAAGPSASDEPSVPTVPQVVVPGVPTAAEIAAESARTADPRGDAPPTAEPERVVYVFVDEDGTEHEVGEDELDEFEVVDDDLDDADDPDAKERP
ncbi:hypothetical protein DX116_19450 [Aeromicrobium endophyticum]|uniref:Uncharacterized protein n=1 Tax=Aeromicrobium endophyticum TaxID=2292704 RepID=A0A371P060_9ACTN|nr:hypothetical protein DX116_19450 [Aeromicrobium endophyticum]